MINTPPIWTQNGRYTAENDRRLISAIIRTEGVANANDMTPSVITNSRQVSIGGGNAFVSGDYTESGGGGMYHVYNEGSSEIQIPTPSSQERIDLVVLKVYDSNVTGDTNEAKFEVVTGVPSNSPAAPSVPLTAIAICQVRVMPGTTALQAQNVSDTRLISTSNGNVLGATTAPQQAQLRQIATATNPVLITDRGAPNQLLMSNGSEFFPVGGTQMISNFSQVPSGVQEGTRVYDKSRYREYQLRDGIWKFVGGDGPQVVVGASKSSVGLTGNRPNKMELNTVTGTLPAWESKSSGDYSNYFYVNTGLPPALSLLKPGLYNITYRYTVVNRSRGSKIWFRSYMRAGGSYGFKMLDELSSFLYLEDGDGTAMTSTGKVSVDATGNGQSNMWLWPCWDSNGVYGIIDYVMRVKMEYEF